MLEQNEQLIRRDGPPTVLFALLGVVLMGGLVAYFLFLQKEAGNSGLPVLTPEATAYLPNLKLQGVTLQAEDTFLEQTVISVNGQIGNLGQRPIRSVLIHCVFRDVYSRELGRFLMPIVRAADPLLVDDAQPFRLAFDTIPEGWNQALPDLFIAEIEFAD